MDDWWPLTSVQQLTRLNGYRPNDGAQGVNFEKGDKAEPEQLENTNEPIPHNQSQPAGQTPDHPTDKPGR
jgi:hypothetical protein